MGTPEDVFNDVLGRQIVLTYAVRATILVKHPEVNYFIDLIGTILSDPDEIRRSIRDPRSMLYYRFNSELLGGKWLVVVVKEVDRFYVSTIYVSDQLKSGESVWQRNR